MLGKKNVVFICMFSELKIVKPRVSYKRSTLSKPSHPTLFSTKIITNTSQRKRQTQTHIAFVPIPVRPIIIVTQYTGNILKIAATEFNSQ